jgi:mRNA interferase MazF
MEIMQGDIFWVNLGEPRGSAPGYKHPYIIIQNDLFNASTINTVIGIALTSNMARAAIPGNVVLQKGEANLSKASVVNVSQLLTLDKSDLSEKIGRVSKLRILEILKGLQLITQPRSLFFR